MSIKIMSVVWELDLPDSEKLALLALADCANDEGFCWPSMATLAKKCSKSDRTVQKAVQSLMEKGHLSRDERPGKGVFYRIHPRRDFAPEAVSPPKGTTQTPEAASDKPSRTINTPLPPKADDSEHEAGDQFWRIPSGKSWADAGPMLRKLEGKPALRTQRQRQATPPTEHTVRQCEEVAARYRRFGDETQAKYWDRRAEELQSTAGRAQHG